MLDSNVNLQLKKLLARLGNSTGETTPDTGPYFPEEPFFGEDNPYGIDWYEKQAQYNDRHGINTWGAGLQAEYTPEEFIPEPYIPNPTIPEHLQYNEWNIPKTNFENWQRIVNGRDPETNPSALMSDKIRDLLKINTIDPELNQNVWKAHAGIQDAIDTVPDRYKHDVTMILPTSRSENVGLYYPEKFKPPFSFLPSSITTMTDPNEATGSIFSDYHKNDPRNLAKEITLHELGHRISDKAQLDQYTRGYGSGTPISEYHPNPNEQWAEDYAWASSGGDFRKINKMAPGTIDPHRIALLERFLTR